VAYKGAKVEVTMYIDKVFYFKSGPSHGFIGGYGGQSVSIYINGDIVKDTYIFDKDTPLNSVLIKNDLSIAKEVQEVIETNKIVINSWQDKLSFQRMDFLNLDGPIYQMGLGNKNVLLVSRDFSWSDLYLSMESYNFSYFDQDFQNLMMLNQMVDIYNKIISILEKNDVRDEKFERIKVDEKISKESKLLSLISWDDFEEHQAEFKNIDYKKDPRLMDHIVNLGMRSGKLEYALTFLRIYGAII